MTPNEISTTLEKNGFTDGVDINPEVSLFEYGILRNPKTEKTILVLTDGEQVFGIDYIEVSLNDVKTQLKNIEPKFFDFIGTPKETLLLNLAANYLASIISSLMAYHNPWDYIDYCYNQNNIIKIALS